jgi:PAS domain S-box-containing protein
MASKLTIAVLGTTPLVKEVALHLHGLQKNVVTAETLAEALQAGAHVLVAGADDLPAVAAARGKGGFGEAPPILAVLRDPQAERVEQLRRQADDVLCWPAGRDGVLQRVQALALAREAKRDAGLRQLYARTVQELGVALATSVEFGDLLVDVLVRLAELACARSATVLVKGDDEKFYCVMGSTNDDLTPRLPVPTSDYPEVAEALLEQREVVVGTDATSARSAALGQRALGSAWVFPLIWDQQAYGCLELGFADEGVLPAATVDMLREAGALVAHALHSSDLYTGLREQTKKKYALAPEARRRLEVLQKYQEIFERSFDGVFVLDRSLRVLHLNPAGEQITGYSLRGLAGSSLVDLVQESDRPRLTHVLEEVTRAGAAQSFDVGLVTTSGDPILVSVSPSAVLTEIELMVLSFRDVTEARALEHELRSTKEFLERLIDSTVDAIVATNMDGLVVLFNQGAERIFGLSAEHVVGQLHMADLYPAGMAETAMSHLRGPEDGGVGRLEAVRQEVLSASAELVPVMLSANLIYQDGAEVGTVAIYSDLRDKLRIERTLAQAQEKLIETEKQALIAELAGTTSHELNQPLTSIMGYAELLQRRFSSEDVNHRAVSAIWSEAERMAEIVRKIGRITRYETKTYVGDTQILDLEKSSE